MRVALNSESVLITHPGVDKASAMQQVSALMDVPLHRFIAFGDSENDASLFRVCGLAVAVANAEVSLKLQADYISTLERGAGVAEILLRALAARS